MSMFDTDSPGYSADRLYDFADAVKEQRKEAALSQPRRFPCDLGCGADFASPLEREVHIICDHEKDAA